MKSDLEIAQGLQSSFIMSEIKNQIVHARATDYISMLVPPLAIAGAAGLAANALFPYLGFIKGYFSLPLAGGIMLALYAAVLCLIDLDARRLLRGMLNDVRQRSRLALRFRES